MLTISSCRWEALWPGLQSRHVRVSVAVLISQIKRAGFGEVESLVLRSQRQQESKVKVLTTFLNHFLPSEWMVCYSWPSADFLLTSTPPPNPSTGLSPLFIWFCALYLLASLGILWVLAANFVMRAHTALASMRASLLHTPPFKVGLASKNMSLNVPTQMALWLPRQIPWLCQEFIV